MRAQGPLLGLLLCLAPVGGKVTIDHHLPGNLFEVTAPVVLTVKADAAGELTAKVRDASGATVSERRFAPGRLDLGVLPPGYYELTVNGPGGEAACSFGVAQFVTRSAPEALAAGSRFGMKLWFSGDIWWNRSLTWRPDEMMDACAALGLQWTRALYNERNYLPTPELIAQHPINVVLKVEMFPPDCYDAARYGPLADWDKTYGKGTWVKGSLPLEQPYKAFLREQLQAIPASQNIYEVWNEAWQWSKTMPAEDFARLCRWVYEVVHEVHPNALVGPNIHGGPTAYDLAFIAAGGLQGADMVAIHPYTAGTPEEKGFRQRLRNYGDLLERKVGRRLPLYATEFGWSTSPAGDRSVSELDQARRTVREALMLYAEDVKTLIPHTLGQREQDPKDREHYFGFFRLNGQPKPALLAFAQCAARIDGSRFVGDLWYGPGIGAMLFERGGEYTVALWTADETKTVDVTTFRRQVTRYDMMGRAETLTTDLGATQLTITGDPLYLVGVGADLAREAAPPTAPLRDDRWRTRAPSLPAVRLAQPPVVDGRLDDWSGEPVLKLADPKIDDLSAQAWFGWADGNLYVAVRVADTHLHNDRPVLQCDLGDAVDLWLCARPDRQVGEAELYDYRLRIAPTCETGQPACVFGSVADEPLVNPPAADPSGPRWAVTTDVKGWTVEAAVPLALLHGEAEPLARVPLLLAVFDRDTANPDEWKTYWKRVENVSKKGPCAERPALVLAP